MSVSVTKKELGRLLTAMVTPFDAESGEVDYQQAKELAIALIRSGSQGVVVSGTTGESPTLSHEEKLQLFAEVKAAIGSSGSVIAGTGSNNTTESIALTNKAEKIGVDAVLLVVPYYNKPTQEGLYQHFAAIAGNTTLPCLLYNVPGRTSVNLAADTVIRLSYIENIVGIKEASGDMKQVANIRRGTESNFLIYSGNDSDTLPVLSLGGYGVISVASHLVGIQIREMIEQFIGGNTAEKGNNIVRAYEINCNLSPLFDILFVIPNPVPIKCALNLIGFPAGKPRLPLIEPDEKTRKLIGSVLQGYHIDLL